MGGDEELENRQPLAEVGADGHFDDLARRICHQAAHSRQLANLVDAAAGAGSCHHVDGVKVVQIGFQRCGDFICRLRPDIDSVFLALLIRKEAALILPVDFCDALFRLGDIFLLLLWNIDIRNRNGDGADGGIVEHGWFP